MSPLGRGSRRRPRHLRCINATQRCDPKNPRHGSQDPTGPQRTRHIGAHSDTLANYGIVSLTELGGIPGEFKYGLAHYLATQAGPVGPHGRPALLTEDRTGVIIYSQQRSFKILYGQSLLIASDAAAGATVNDPSSAVAIAAAAASSI